MAKIFEQISDRWSSWFETLSAREKKLLALLFSAFIVLLIFLTLYIATSKISDKKANLVKNQSQLAQIIALEGEYRSAKEKNESMVESIRSNDISLLSMIPKVASRLGLTVKELTEQRRPLGKTDNVEVSVKVNLTKLSMDKVSALIEQIEDENQGIVKVTRLKINTRFDEPDLLDVQMTVSTWKSA
ncbi:MAG: type II secretion system protein M [Myxococcales bacterium]|nr:type II secretion system protein M [Myxococcales bacterium]USN49890.1 MAG: type II secretion system protein M [Myxococcales bacterium]